MLDVKDDDDILAFAKHLAKEYPNRMWEVEEAVVSSTPLQVCVWDMEGNLMANVDIVTSEFTMWIGEPFDIERALEDAIDLAKEE